MINLAFDLGASSGRAIIGRFSKDKLSIKEIHRFVNNPVKVGDHFHWDILHLFHEMKQGLLGAKQQGYDVKTLGIDTWGLDFGLLDGNGELLSNPFHYRDKQSVGMEEMISKIIAKEEIYSRTGIQFLEVNTINHLFAMKLRRSSALEKAATLLPVADLLRYFFTGDKTAEETIASTTQLYKGEEKGWSKEIIEALELPINIFPEIVEAGTIVGQLNKSVCKELHIDSIHVVAVGEHDTASAVVSVPTVEKDFAYLSCGTWSLLGTELDVPIINAKAMNMNVTNERGVFNTYRLLKNIMGLWLIQECKRLWEKEGIHIRYDEMTQLAENATPFYAFIDPDDSLFINPHDMEQCIKDFCKETNQRVPETKGQIIRCILESLALKYRVVLDEIESLTGKSFPSLHLVGGGVKNRLLCQFTANAISRPVFAGPEEATAIGNMIVQLIAKGEIKDLNEGRLVVKRSFPYQVYEPKELKQWNEAYGYYKEILRLRFKDRVR